MKKSEFKTISLKIGSNLVGKRLDKLLAEKDFFCSRTKIVFLIQNGLIKVNDKKVKPSYHVRLNDLILIQVSNDEFLSKNFSKKNFDEEELQPLDLKLDIIFEDDYLIVLNKPAGLVVHPACGHRNDTLVNALIAYTAKLSNIINITTNNSSNNNINTATATTNNTNTNITNNTNTTTTNNINTNNNNNFRPGIVHRIDKETSGLLVIAKDNYIHLKLANQFKNRQVHRIYQAICYGKFKRLSGKYISYLARNPNNRKKIISLHSSKQIISKRQSSQKISSNSNFDFSSDTSPDTSSDFPSDTLPDISLPVKKAKLAITNYHVLSYNSDLDLSLLELKLETGRTHQIRVHLSEDQHPIVGDNLYGSEKWANKIKLNSIKDLIKNMNRCALLAKELGFFHPITEQFLKFKIDWPENIKNIFKDEFDI